MLSFSSSQKNAFTEARLSSFAETLSTRARNIHAATTDSMGTEELVETMACAIKAAHKLGLRRRSELERFADLTLVLEPGFETSEDWARDIFAKPNISPTDKLSEVEGCAFFLIREETS